MKHSSVFLGTVGEQLASDYLQHKGMRLITTNWQCKLGEIDLVMQEGSIRVLVEVRLRKPTRYGQGYETVAYQKQRKLIRAAQLYQQQENYWGDMRFDVVSIITGTDGEASIEHIEDAFSL